ncbi:hypothetical protein QYM36_004265 [Artemia franciscana]|uniref:RNA-directed DNA polymerase n=1 Tax=Artemia franciscana TaxID=6661 RepID=A0AA88I2C2_ARTSF|nr:hypothetical protein QYM36_004265 [Artemia franciscana]
MEGTHGSQEQEIYIDTLLIGAIAEKSSQPTVAIKLNNSAWETLFKIDTGAEANVISKSIFDRLKPKPQLNKTSQILVAYGGTRIPIAGVCSLNYRHKGIINKKYSFFIVDTQSNPILGYQASVEMGFVKVITSISSLSTKKSVQKNPIPKEFDDVFAGIGKLPGKVKIHVEKNAIPSINPVRRIPFASHERVKSELERLEKLDIIERVVAPTEWVNSIVAVEKSDSSLRLCLDPRELNKSIQRAYYPMPTFEDIAAKIHDHNKFSKLDATFWYLMLALNEKSSLVTTFNTPFGRYKYKRMPFGLICAQDEFQRKMEETFGNLKGVGVIVDDILVSGKDEEHDENLRKVLETAREVGVRFNPEKCIFGSTSVPCFGHLITADGIKPDPSKVQAIIEMPHPSNKDELATFLGMTNFLSKYIPNLSSLNYPLRELGKQTVFERTNEHATAMNRIRTSICNNLATFDTKTKSVEMKTDASKHGLGAELSVGGKIVAFGSRALTSTEQNYSQIEKELYAILYDCKKFQQFVYGRRIIAHTDHKPLEAILSKPLSQAPPRLQRMMIQLQP